MRRNAFVAIHLECSHAFIEIAALDLLAQQVEFGISQLLEDLGLANRIRFVIEARLVLGEAISLKRVRQQKCRRNSQSRAASSPHDHDRPYFFFSFTSRSSTRTR